MCGSADDEINQVLQRLEADSALQAYDYQSQTAEALFEGRNVLLRVPTGCGKTWSAVLPFLMPHCWKAPPHRLIYVLPLRTLIESVAETLREVLPRLDGWTTEHVKVQTGVNPEDPFFSTGRIIVTTFDQLLSGLLGSPYGLGPSLHNINSAALAGCLLVFDEFHLMEPDQAFMTALAGCIGFRGMSQSVWMTATATPPLCDQLSQHLSVASIPLSDRDAASIPALQADKRLIVEDRQLQARDILDRPGRRLVVVNQVKRSQKLFRDVKAEVGECIPVVLLHSRFLSGDRSDNQDTVLQMFGKSSTLKEGIVIATQVVEAGLDITADSLLTELAPANSLVQRAGRCARYGGYGEVHVFALPEEEERPWLPYGEEMIDRTRDALRHYETLTFGEAAGLVEEVHTVDDEAAVAMGAYDRLQTLWSTVSQNNILKTPAPVTHLIRKADLSAKLIIGEPPVLDDEESFTPGQREGVKVSIASLRKLKSDSPDAALYCWAYSSDGLGYWTRWDERDAPSFHYLASPRFARYTSDCGLELGQSGCQCSPIRDAPERPGYAAPGRESWVDHAAHVRQWAVAKWEAEAQAGPNETLLAVGLRARYGVEPGNLKRAIAFVAGTHDLGKLQTGWQEWAECVEKAVDSSFELGQPLAHTSARLGNVPLTRPRHAMQGAYLALRLIEANKEHFGLGDQATTGALIAAIVAHHGGGYSPSELQSLSPLAREAVKEVFGVSIGEIKPETMTGTMSALGQQLQKVEVLQEFWPLIAYVTRLLRLSDQTATAEGGVCE